MGEAPSSELPRDVAELEARYNKVREEFKDYIETSRRNEGVRKRELRLESAKKMLAFADSLSRVACSGEEGSCETVRNYQDTLQKNIDVLYAQFLSGTGLAPIDPAPGTAFDDVVHTAVGIEYAGQFPVNSVVRVVRRGYRFDDTVVRPAEVVIAKPPAGAARSERPASSGEEEAGWDRFIGWLFPSRKRVAELGRELAWLKREHAEVAGRLDRELGVLEEVATQTVACRERLDSLDRFCGELDDRVERLEQDNKAPKALAAQVAAVKNYLGDLEDAQLRAEDGAARRFSGLEERFSTVESRYRALKEQCRALEDQSRALEGKSAALQDGIGDLSDHYNILAERLRAVEGARLPAGARDQGIGASPTTPAPTEVPDPVLGPIIADLFRTTESEGAAPGEAGTSVPKPLPAAEASRTGLPQPQQPISRPSPSDSVQDSCRIKTAPHGRGPC